MQTMSLTLPEPLATYFVAANAHDADRVAACFARDAVVRDEGRDIRGHDAVRAWVAETSRKYRHKTDVLAAETAADRTVVTARVAGNFPGSPIDLRYRFTLAAGQIAGLEIGL
jgi:ketosteroid isomerase-like protein